METRTWARRPEGAGAPSGRGSLPLRLGIKVGTDRPMVGAGYAQDLIGRGRPVVGEDAIDRQTEPERTHARKGRGCSGEAIDLSQILESEATQPRYHLAARNFAYCGD